MSVQLGSAGEWQITGYVAKAASKSRFLTNLAQGGKVHRLEDILQEEYPHLNPRKVVRDISELALRIADHLGQHLPDLADLGMDIGLTVDGFPMFIECNGKDQRYSFREAGMLDVWKASYENPMAYAKYLLTRRMESQL
ncbi:Endospore coat-associated protein yheD [Mycobacterium tuberculosis]|nr:Endospore coat-associated protein yheD [Mycobacterium tuberculosis]